MVLDTKLNGKRASLAVDTGASVNCLSEQAYLELKRVSHNSRLPLKPSNLNLKGVSNAQLSILGIVRLPLQLGKHTKHLQLDFYVVSDFSLPADGLLGLHSMRATHMAIFPDVNKVYCMNKFFTAMEEPKRLLSPSHLRNSVTPTSNNTQCVPGVHSALRSQHTCTSVESTNKISPENWITVKATVLGNHRIPSRTAAHIPISVPKSTIGCDILLDGATKNRKIEVEPAINTVREGHTTTALVVNSTPSVISLKQGEFLTQALAYDKQVTPDPMVLPQACIASLVTPQVGDETIPSRTLDSLVECGDYPELKENMVSMLEQFRDVVALPGEPLGLTALTEHHIKLKPNTSPVYIPAYRLPHSQRAIVDKQVAELLDQGVISHSKSPWNSPLFLVPKKDGSYRPVVDFRKVNAVTEDDRFPLPVLRDLLMSLGQGNKYFTSLDLLSGYWQVPMAPKSKPITAFSTPSGHYHWNRLVMGLKGSSITFQRFLSTLFADLLGKHVSIYLDDIIVYSKDPDSHFANLKSVLLKLREAGLKVKLSKCHFLRKSITFLGHSVDAEGIHTLDSKIKAVNNFPTPTTTENVRSFLGLCGYYRAFIKGFSSLAAPLNSLLKKDTPFHWDAAQENSFMKLKFALTHAPVLVFPDYTKPFIIYTDASGTGLGAVVMQQDEEGKNRAIAYASRTLSPAEHNYSVTHLECLAVIWALKTFRDMIFGYEIICYTDHAPIKDLFKGRNLSGRLARWYLTIQEYNPTFKYVPGRANTVADSLSRNVQVGAVTEQVEVLDNFSVHELVRAQRQHEMWSKVIYHLESGDEISLPTLHVPLSQFYLDQDGILCRNWRDKRSSAAQLVIPEVYVPTVLKLIHDAPNAGHPGKERTLAAARVNYYWPTMQADIAKHVERCLKCAQCKGHLPKPAPILEYPPPTRPWDVVAMDILKLPASRQGSKYLLVCVDHFSRYVVLAPLKDRTASAIAHALITKLFHIYSTPRVLLSDNAAEFTGSLLSEICTQYGIKQSFITAYHPASNGLVERANKKILDVLRPVVSGLLDTWEDWLTQVALSINSNLCESTGHSPHYVVFGEEIRLPSHLLGSAPPPVYNVDDYVSAQRKVFSDIHRQVKERLQDSKSKMSAKQHKVSEPVTLQVGDSVMVRVPDRHSKLSPNFVGPRLVVTKLSGNKFEILDPLLNTLEIIHSDRLKRTQVKAEPELARTAHVADATHLNSAPSNDPTHTPTHTYNLRKRN